MGFWKWLGLSTWKRLRKIKNIHIEKEDFEIAKVLIGLLGGIISFAIVFPMVALCSPIQLETLSILALIGSSLFLLALHGWYKLELEDC